MKDKDYAVMNLRTIRENIYAYATFAPEIPYEKVEAAQAAVDELINEIENNKEMQLTF